MDLGDRIKYEGESTTLDFKKSFYPTAKRADLLTDVMAMANAETRDDRYIVFGVKLLPDGTKTFHNLDEFPDPADIEQLVMQNIEPAVHVEFSPFEFEGHRLAYLRIHQCEGQPYLMRKDFSSLTQGSGKIRKGTTTLPLLRADYDKIYEAKNQSPDIRKFIKIYWDCEPPSKEICLPRPHLAQLPSKVETDKIRHHINNLERIEFEKKNPKTAGNGMRASQPLVSAWLNANSDLQALGKLVETLDGLGFGGPRDPYRGLSKEELVARLERVAQDFKEEDCYYVYMELGQNINLQIQNDGPQYLDDAVLILTISGRLGLSIASKLPRKPLRSQGPFGIKVPDIGGLTHDHLLYPSVGIEGDEIVVKAKLKQIQNGVMTKAFGKPLRIALAQCGNSDPIPVRLKLVARGLPSPFEDVVFIKPV